MLMAHLFEAGIRTAPIDKLARKALAQAIPAAVETAVSRAKDHVPPIRMTGDPGWEYPDNSRHYDDLYNYFQANPEALVVPFLDAFSRALTNVVRSYVVQVIPTIPWLVEFFKTTSDTYEQYAARYRVEVDAREGSTDKYASKTDGYADWSGLIKVFVNTNAVFDAGMNLVELSVIGEGADDSLQQMMKTVIPIFVHEYAHMEQSLRREWHHRKRDGRKSSVDFGHITLGKNRGGTMRTPWESEAAELRYLGNVKEIDSFASDTAATLMHSVLGSERKSWERDRVVSRIDDLKASLAYSGYDTSYERYSRLLRDAFDGRYAHLNLNPEEARKAFKVFIKKVAAKLDDYKADYHGRAKRDPIFPDRVSDYSEDSPRFADLPADYVAIAEANSFAETVKILAKRTAQTVLDSAGPFDDPVRTAANGFDPAVTKAESFIRRYYFGDRYSDKVEKAGDLFRQITAKYVSRMAMRKAA